MRETWELLNQLAEEGIRLSIDNGRLNCYTPAGPLSEGLHQKISQSKSQILGILTRSGLDFEAKAKGEHSTMTLTEADINLETEAVLDDDIRPLLASTEGINTAQTRSTFLTGASGFLGAFLLRDILASTKVHVYCLIRSRSEKDGRERIQNTLAKYGLWQTEFTTRFTAIPGDLEKPLLGLNAETFRFLCSEVDAVYHCGALVNFIESYDVLKPSNVLGTKEVIRLASTIKLKPMHFISSVAVFPPKVNHNGKILESDPLPDWRDLPGGYGQTKWVAEKLVMAAAHRGLPVRIYRPEMVVGDSTTGVCNTRDFVPRMIIGCVQLCAAPDTNALVGMVPVDYVSRAIIHLSQQKNGWSEVFHLVHPCRISASESASIFDTAGYRIDILPYTEWRHRLLEDTKRSTQNALFPLLPLLTEASPFEKAPVYDCSRTLAGLSNSTIACPPIDGQLMSTYLGYFRKSGYLE